MFHIRFTKEACAGGKLTLIHGDVLELKRAELGLKENEYAVVANIPYYITGAILESFLQYEPRPSRMILLVQKEVADRIMARDAKESILSMSVKAFGTPKMIAKVPPGAFTPPPTVDSAILEISAISNERFLQSKADIADFFKILRVGFAHKRKFLKSNLKETVPIEKLEKTWGVLGLNEKARAEDLSPDQWFAIARELEA